MGNRAAPDPVEAGVRHRRIVLLALAAGLSSAAALAVVNMLIGPTVCAVPAICAPPLPGKSGCGPVQAVCSDTLVSTAVIVAVSVGVGLSVGLGLALRRNGS